MLQPALMSFDRQDWCTPPEFLSLVRQLAPIGLDPCSNPNSVVNAVTSWELDRDGDSLEKSWAGRSLVFVNPPYGKEQVRWLRKVAFEYLYDDVESITLVPARTDTRAFHGIMEDAHAVCFLKGRLTFLNAPHPAPFPSVVIYFGPHAIEFKEVFSNHGLVWIR